jgi:hypothetical protein
MLASINPIIIGKLIAQVIRIGMFRLTSELISMLLNLTMGVKTNVCAVLNSFLNSSIHSLG